MILDAQNTFFDRAALPTDTTAKYSAESTKSVVVNGGGVAANPMCLYVILENVAVADVGKELEVSLLSGSSAVFNASNTALITVKAKSGEPAKVKIPYTANGKYFGISYKAAAAFSAGTFTAALVADVDLP